MLYVIILLYKTTITKGIPLLLVLYASNINSNNDVMVLVAAMLSSMLHNALSNFGEQ